MRRIHIVLSVLGLLTAGAIGIVAGCGSDDPAPIAAPLDGAAGSDATSTSSSTGGSSSSSSSGDPGDGGSTTSSSSSTSGSVPSNPGKVTCGTAECDGGNGSFCCVKDNGSTCLLGNQGNQCNGQNTAEIRCDEGADCPPLGGGGGLPRKCCLARNGGVETSCGATCGGGGGEPARAQLCKTDAECSDGGANQPTCAEKTCRGLKMRVCGSPVDCQ